ncbi:hypothetical protein ACWC5I_10340 [Kitasatospora sp. NPDC001574]
MASTSAVCPNSAGDTRSGGNSAANPGEGYSFSGALARERQALRSAVQAGADQRITRGRQILDQQGDEFLARYLAGNTYQVDPDTDQLVSDKFKAELTLHEFVDRPNLARVLPEFAAFVDLALDLGYALTGDPQMDPVRAFQTGAILLGYDRLEDALDTDADTFAERLLRRPETRAAAFAIRLGLVWGVDLMAVEVIGVHLVLQPPADHRHTDPEGWYASLIKIGNRDTATVTALIALLVPLALVLALRMPMALIARPAPPGRAPPPGPPPQWMQLLVLAVRPADSYHPLPVQAGAV